MRPADRAIVLERMRILMREAVSNATSDPRLAERQAAMARRLSTRHRVRMPYEMRAAFCRKCKMFISYGARSRIRVGGAAVRGVRITCLLCGTTRRKVIRRRPDSSPRAG